ncbi:MAG TPA: hypothetical protein VIO33_25105 [Burkholderiaceae bacterium]
MKTKISLIALAVSSSFAVLSASAQAAPTYHWIPAGEAVDPVTAPPDTSTTTREAVREQTLEARNRGGLQTAGDIGGDRRARAELAVPSTQSRAEVRAETLAAIHDGTIAPFGETAGAE